MVVGARGAVEVVEGLGSPEGDLVGVMALVMWGGFGKHLGEVLGDHLGEVLGELPGEGLGQGRCEPSREACEWLPGPADTDSPQRLGLGRREYHAGPRRLLLGTGRSEDDPVCTNFC